MAKPKADVKVDRNSDGFDKQLYTALMDRILTKRCRYCGVMRSNSSLLSDALDVYMLDVGVVGLAQIQCRSCYKTDKALSNGFILDEIPEEMKVRPTLADIAATHTLIQHNEIVHDLLELMLVAATDDEEIRKEQHTGMASFMFENARRVCEEWCKGEFAELRQLKYLRLRAETLISLPQVPTNISPEYIEMYQMMCRTFAAHRNSVLILLDLLRETLFRNPTVHSFMLWVTVAMMHVERYADFKANYCGGRGGEDALKFDEGEFESVVERYLTLEMPIGVKKIPVVFVLFELPRFYHYVTLLAKMCGPPAVIPKVFLNKSQSASYRSIENRAEMNPLGFDRVERLGILVWPQKELDDLNRKNEEEQRMFYERHHSDDEESEEKGRGKPAKSKIPKFLRRKGWEPHFKRDLIPPPPTTLVPSIQLDPTSAMVQYASSVPSPLDSRGRPREKKTIIVATVDAETLKQQGYHLDGIYDKATIITSEDGTTILEGTATAEDIQRCVSKDYDIYAHQEGTGYLTFQPDSTKGPTHLAGVAKGCADPRQGLEGCLLQHGLAGRSHDRSEKDPLRMKLREKKKALRAGNKPKPSQTLLSYTGLDSTSAGYLAIPFNPSKDGPLGAHVMGAVDRLKEQTKQQKLLQKRNKRKETCSSPPPPPHLGTYERGFVTPSLSEAFKKTDHSAVKAYVLNKDMDLMNMLDEKGLMMPVEDEIESTMQGTDDFKKEKKKSKKPGEVTIDDSVDWEEGWSPPSSRKGYACSKRTPFNEVPFYDREEKMMTDLKHNERDGLDLEGNGGAKKKKKKKKKRKNAVEDPVIGPQTKDCTTEAIHSLIKTGDHTTNTRECVTTSRDRVAGAMEPDAETGSQKTMNKPASEDVTTPLALSSCSEAATPRQEEGGTPKGEVSSSKIVSVEGGRVEVEESMKCVASEACAKLSSCSLSAEPCNQPPSTPPLSNGTARKTARDKFKECDNCHREILDRIRVCSACKRVAYCNGNCQKEHWKVHKETCSYYLKKDITG